MATIEGANAKLDELQKILPNVGIPQLNNIISGRISSVSGRRDNGEAYTHWSVQMSFNNEMDENQIARNLFTRKDVPEIAVILAEQGIDEKEYQSHLREQHDQQPRDNVLGIRINSVTNPNTLAASIISNLVYDIKVNGMRGSGPELLSQAKELAEVLVRDQEYQAATPERKLARAQEVHRSILLTSREHYAEQAANAVGTKQPVARR